MRSVLQDFSNKPTLNKNLKPQPQTPNPICKQNPTKPNQHPYVLPFALIEQEQKRQIAASNSLVKVGVNVIQKQNHNKRAGRSSWKGGRLTDMWSIGDVKMYGRYGDCGTSKLARVLDHSFKVRSIDQSRSDTIQKIQKLVHQQQYKLQQSQQDQKFEETQKQQNNSQSNKYVNKNQGQDKIISNKKNKMETIHQLQKQQKPQSQQNKKQKNKYCSVKRKSKKQNVIRVNKTNLNDSCKQGYKNDQITVIDQTTTVTDKQKLRCPHSIEKKDQKTQNNQAYKTVNKDNDERDKLKQKYKKTVQKVFLHISSKSNYPALEVPEQALYILGSVLQQIKIPKQDQLRNQQGKQKDKNPKQSQKSAQMKLVYQKFMEACLKLYQGMDYQEIVWFIQGLTSFWDQLAQRQLQQSNSQTYDLDNDYGSYQTNAEHNIQSSVQTKVRQNIEQFMKINKKFNNRNYVTNKNKKNQNTDMFIKKLLNSSKNQNQLKPKYKNRQQLPKIYGCQSHRTNKNNRSNRQQIMRKQLNKEFKNNEQYKETYINKEQKSQDPESRGKGAPIIHFQRTQNTKYPHINILQNINLSRNISSFYDNENDNDHYNSNNVDNHTNFVGNLEQDAAVEAEAETETGLACIVYTETQKQQQLTQKSDQEESYWGGQQLQQQDLQKYQLQDQKQLQQQQQCQRRQHMQKQQLVLQQLKEQQKSIQLPLEQQLYSQQQLQQSFQQEQENKTSKRQKQQPNQKLQENSTLNYSFNTIQIKTITSRNKENNQNYDLSSRNNKKSNNTNVIPSNINKNHPQTEQSHSNPILTPKTPRKVSNQLLCQSPQKEQQTYAISSPYTKLISGLGSPIINEEKFQCLIHTQKQRQYLNRSRNYGQTQRDYMPGGDIELRANGCSVENTNGNVNKGWVSDRLIHCQTPSTPSHRPPTPLPKYNYLQKHTGNPIENSPNTTNAAQSIGANNPVVKDSTGNTKQMEERIYKHMKQKMDNILDKYNVNVINGYWVGDRQMQGLQHRGSRSYRNNRDSRMHIDNNYRYTHQKHRDILKNDPTNIPTPTLLSNITNKIESIHQTLNKPQNFFQNSIKKKTELYPYNTNLRHQHQRINFDKPNVGRSLLQSRNSAKMENFQQQIERRIKVIEIYRDMQSIGQGFDTGKCGQIERYLCRGDRSRVNSRSGNSHSNYILNKQQKRHRSLSYQTRQNYFENLQHEIKAEKQKFYYILHNNQYKGRSLDKSNENLQFASRNKREAQLYQKINRHLRNSNRSFNIGAQNYMDQTKMFHNKFQYN